MSEVSKVVFVAFTQHCIQSNPVTVTHVGGVKCTLYTGPLAPPGGKAIYLSLPPCGFSGSPPVSLRRQLC